MKRIGLEAFCRCEQLKQVIFAKDSELETIEKNCFRESGLETVVIPAEVTSIDDGAFLKCKKLGVVTFSEASRLTRIGKDCFGESGIKSIAFPPLVRHVGFGAF